MTVNNMLKFIDESPNGFYAVKNMKDLLSANGFREIQLEDQWDLEVGGKYFVDVYHSACISFVIGSENLENDGYKIITAHTDSPCFKIKPNPQVKFNNYIKLNTETYGGPILNTWLDRPLSVAGKIVLKGESILKPKTQFVNINRPIMTIPNLAIHMNRSVNEGIPLNKQIDMLPILGCINDELESDNYLIKLIAEELKVNVEEIIDFDLFIYAFEKGMKIGMSGELISSPRLDDLALCYVSLMSIINEKPSSGINVFAALDNEEIGSRTKQGADSQMLSIVLERISLALGKSREAFLRSLTRSFMISADVAHAIHPNKPEKHDISNKPLLNGGPVIKMSANQKYTTDSTDIALYKQLCDKAKVNLQVFVNRSDERGGSTIGPISASHLPIRTVDMGVAMLAMHSARELIGTKDIECTAKTLEEFYKL